MRSKNLAPKSIGFYVSAICKLYYMNDIITLNWKKIHSFEPEQESSNGFKTNLHDGSDNSALSAVMIATPIMAQNMTGGNMTGKISGVEGGGTSC